MVESRIAPLDDKYVISIPYKEFHIPVTVIIGLGIDWFKSEVDHGPDYVSPGKPALDFHFYCPGPLPGHSPGVRTAASADSDGECPCLFWRRHFCHRFCIKIGSFLEWYQKVSQMAHWMLTDTAGVAKTYATQADGNHAERIGGAPSAGVNGAGTEAPDRQSGRIWY